MGLHQAEGLLNEVMQLVDPSQWVDAHDAKKLFETEGKIRRGDGHLPDQLIDALEPRIVNMIESHEDEQDVLLNATEGLVEDEQIAALCQHLLLPGGMKAQVCSPHGHAQFAGIDPRLLLPPGEH